MVRRAFIYVVAMVLATSSLLALPSPTHALTRDNWTVQYTTTDGDGLQLTGGYFKGTKVFARVTLPFVKVTYQEAPNCCTDNLSNLQRRAGPSVANQSGGFQIYSVYCFGACLPYNGSDSYSYKYIERYFFYNTGLFVARLDIYGPSIHPTATYEVFFRVDYEIAASTNSFDQFASGAWVRRTAENKYCDDGLNDQYGNEWKQNNAAGTLNYGVEPLSVNQNYCDLALVYNSAEISSTGSSYPTVWDNNQNINGADVVQWYWGYRLYTRPAGCEAGGAGCVNAFPVSFDGSDSGW